jgi:hypothetical protein
LPLLLVSRATLWAENSSRTSRCVSPVKTGRSRYYSAGTELDQYELSRVFRAIDVPVDDIVKASKGRSSMYKVKLGLFRVNAQYLDWT